MSVKKQLISELRLQKRIKGNSFAKFARESGLSSETFRLFMSDPNRGINSNNLDQIADVLGKRFILIDKEH